MHITYILTYKLYSRNIEIETVFTKTEMNNEGNINSLRACRLVYNICESMRCGFKILGGTIKLSP